MVPLLTSKEKDMSKALEEGLEELDKLDKITHNVLVIRNNQGPNSDLFYFLIKKLKEIYYEIIFHSGYSRLGNIDFDYKEICEIDSKIKILGSDGIVECNKEIIQKETYLEDIYYKKYLKYKNKYLKLKN